MALSFSGTQVVKFGSVGDALTGPQKISYIRWTGATTAGHRCRVTDTAGNVIFPSQADGAHFLDIQPIFQMRRGITILSMASGTVYVYRE